MKVQSKSNYNLFQEPIKVSFILMSSQRVDFTKYDKVTQLISSQSRIIYEAEFWPRLLASKMGRLWIFLGHRAVYLLNITFFVFDLNQEKPALYTTKL